MLDWLKGRLRRDRDAEAAMDREISFHVEELTARNQAQGMSVQEARRQALLAFGGREQITQQVREVHTSVWLEAGWFHIQAAWRFVRRAPGFALAVVLTLALGIGANSAVFSAVDAVVLRPLALPHGDELVAVHQMDAKRNGQETPVATQRIEDWNRLNGTFQAIGGYYTGDATITDGALPMRETVAFVAPRFLELWGVQPVLGRGFTAEEQHFGGPGAVLISYRYWQRQLRGDPAVVGRLLHQGRAAYTIVGVMPASFRFPDRDVNLWQPNPVDAPYAQDRASTWFLVQGRLKPGVTLGRAAADLRRVQSQLAQQFPATDAPLSVRVSPLKKDVLHGVESSLWLLYAAVTALLLIACTNIAALLLARTTERTHEIAIRFALGASRARIVMQLLTEVLLLVAAGALFGLLLATQTAHVLRWLARDLPRLEDIGLSWPLVAYTAASTLAVTLLCGLWPALRVTQGGMRAALTQAGRGQVSRGRARWQWTLVGTEVALAVCLLVVSGLLLRSFAALGEVDLGFEPTHVLSFHVSSGWGETMDMGRLAQRINRTLDGLRALPGVEAAATSGALPGNAAELPTEYSLLGNARAPEEKIMADARFVSADYFRTMHIPILRGTECPASSPTPTVLVNRSFVARYVGEGSEGIGYRLRGVNSSTLQETAEIRGVVGDTREVSSDVPPQPAVYWCVSASGPDPNYLVRTRDDPARMVEAVRRAVHQLEPERSVFGTMPLEEHLGERFALMRLRTTLLAAFAAIAVGLVTLGLYATVSFLVRTRRREMGLRLAVGAEPGQLVRGFVQQALWVALIGGAPGFALHAVRRVIAGPCDLRRGGAADGSGDNRRHRAAGAAGRAGEPDGDPAGGVSTQGAPPLPA